MSSPKRFDRSLYDECNNAALDACISFFAQIGGHTLKDRTEAYKSHDFIFATPDNNDVKVEAEVKRCWTDHDCFPYPTVDVPFRKNESKADLFVIFNKHLDMVATCPMHVVLSSPTKVKNTSCTQDETFFTVDASRFRWYRKDAGGKWFISTRVKRLSLVYDA